MMTHKPAGWKTRITPEAMTMTHPHPWLRNCCRTRSPVYAVSALSIVLLISSAVLLLQDPSEVIVAEFHLPSIQILSPTNKTKVPLGYWEMDVQYRFPEPDQRYTTALGFLPWWLPPFRKSCYQHARAVAEQYTQLYHPRKGLPGPHPGGVPRALFRWDAGRITRKQFDAVPGKMRGSQCIHCVSSLRFKILKGKLYQHEYVWDQTDPYQVNSVKEQLLVALYLYPELPDMDFIVHIGDGCPEGHPVLNWNICRDKPLAGFTYPSYSAWEMGLGPAGVNELHKCYMTRYPITERKPKVFWRGRTTNLLFTEDGGKPITPGNMFEVPRVRLHNITLPHGPGLDIKIVDFVEAGDDRKVKKMVPSGLARKSNFEDFNQNAIVLDIDGNGWSDRFVQLARFNTPILKQASNFSAFFEHLFAPGSVVESYKQDLSDVVERGKHLLAEYQEDPSRLIAMAQKMQGLASVLLTHVALTEALAYSLQVYASMTDWTAVEEPGYSLVSPTFCCKYAKLPAGLIKDMHAKAGQQQ